MGCYAKSEALAKSELWARREQLAIREALAKSELWVQSELLAMREALAKSELWTMREALAKSELWQKQHDCDTCYYVLHNATLLLIHLRGMLE